MALIKPVGFLLFTSLESGCHQNVMFCTLLRSYSGNEWWMKYTSETKNEKRHHLPVIGQPDVICVCSLCKSEFCFCDFSLLWGGSSEIYAQCTIGEDLIWQNRTANLISILCERYLASLLSCNMALCEIYRCITFLNGKFSYTEFARFP